MQLLCWSARRAHSRGGVATFRAGQDGPGREKCASRSATRCGATNVRHDYVPDERSRGSTAEAAHGLR